MKEIPSGGDYFLFLNKPKTHLKILYFDRTGFVIWYKRLERGTFTHPEKREISGVELMCLLEGIEVIKSKQKKRYFIGKNEENLSQKMGICST